MYHHRKALKRYKSFPKPKSDECHFCGKDQVAIVAETEHARIIRNRVSYDVWELRKVVEHLMVIPKRHVTSLKGLHDAERIDIMKIIGDYESRGYNVYARSAGNLMRSVPHQHTHLIKTAGKLAKFTFYLKKPYIFIKL